MGGNVFGAERMTPLEYKRKVARLFELLSPISSAITMAIPPHYRDKESFGDIDFMVKASPMADLLIRGLLTKNNVQQFRESSGKDDLDFFIEFEGTQVDFLHHPPEMYDCALRYNSYNSLGMVIGMMCRHAGFKLTAQGLFYQVYHPTRLTECLATLKVTSDFDDICRFVKLDPNRHRQGFNSMSDMHDYITTSECFSSNFFTLGEMNHNKRRKLRYNAMYVSIKEYLENKPELARDIPDFQASFERASDMFPHFCCEVKEVVREALHQDSVKKKLSREDIQLLFEVVDIPFEERSSFLAKLTPLALKDWAFDEMGKDAKRAWFIRAAEYIKKSHKG